MDLIALPQPIAAALAALLTAGVTCANLTLSDGRAVKLRVRRGKAEIDVASPPVEPAAMVAALTPRPQSNCTAERMGEPRCKSGDGCLYHSDCDLSPTGPTAEPAPASCERGAGSSPTIAAPGEAARPAVAGGGGPAALTRSAALDEVASALESAGLRLTRDYVRGQIRVLGPGGRRMWCIPILCDVCGGAGVVPRDGEAVPCPLCRAPALSAIDAGSETTNKSAARAA